MGSFFAGIKAGTLAGVAYQSGLGFFDISLPYAHKSEVLSLIQQQYSQVCTAHALPV